MNTQIPLYIPTNPKVLKILLFVYSFALLGCIFGWWIASGKFFTQEYYYPGPFLTLPVLFFVMVYSILKQIRKINQKEPVAILDQTGIQYFGSPRLNQITSVEWKDVVGIERQDVHYVPFLVIFVRDVTVYIDRINGSKKRKAWNLYQRKKSNEALRIELKNLDYPMDEFEKAVKYLATNYLNS